MEKMEGKRPLGRSRHRWEDHIKTDRGETGWLSVDWMHLAVERDCWWALVNVVRAFRFH